MKVDAQYRINRLSGTDAVASVFNEFFGSLPYPAVEPNIKVNQDGESLTLEMAVPGLTSRDIDVTVSEGVLHLKSSKEVSGIFTKPFHVKRVIPEYVDVAKMTAFVRNGILNVCFPFASSGYS